MFILKTFALLWKMALKPINNKLVFQCVRRYKKTQISQAIDDQRFHVSLKSNYQVFLCFALQVLP